jgi:ABC-2 type transport system ATP-binding protein
VIQEDEVCKKYGARRALQHLNVTIPEFSVTAILGPNGAGKSTFMRMITGMA